MGLSNALYCDKVATMIFSEGHIAHSSATALSKPNADIAVVLGSCAVMSQHLAQKCMSACAVMSEHLAQGCFGLAAVASQHWAQRSHCVAEFAPHNVSILIAHGFSWVLFLYPKRSCAFSFSLVSRLGLALRRR